MQLSYDIWEECENIHAYSIASIFAALNKMLKIYEIIRPFYETNRLKLEQISKAEKKGCRFRRHPFGMERNLRSDDYAAGRMFFIDIHIKRMPKNMMNPIIPKVGMMKPMINERTPGANPAQ